MPRDPFDLIKPALLPCPFCGGPAEYDDHDTDHYGLDCPGVGCAACDVRNYADTKAEAITNWNKRTNVNPEGGEMLKETWGLLDKIDRGIQVKSFVQVNWDPEGLVIQVSARVATETYSFRQILLHEEMATMISDDPFIDFFVERFNRGYREAVLKVRKEG